MAVVKFNVFLIAVLGVITLVEAVIICSGFQSPNSQTPAQEGIADSISTRELVVVDDKNQPRIHLLLVDNTSVVVIRDAKRRERLVLRAGDSGGDIALYGKSKVTARIRFEDSEGTSFWVTDPKGKTHYVFGKP